MFLWPKGLWSILQLPAFIGFFGAVVYVLFAIRCPRCNGRLGQTFASHGIPFSETKVRFCPFCGLDFDSQDATV